jgi:hypothetical protein
MGGDIAMDFGHYLKKERIMMWMDDKIFTQLTEEYFLFLQKEYRMNVQDKKVAGCVSFKSNITWIEILFDKYSLFIEMGTNDGLYQVSLWDVMQFATGEGNSASYMASDEEKLKKGLQRLSDYVKLYCHKALSGDIEFYKELQRCKEKREQEYAFKNKISNIEELAKAAWEKQNYKKIIDLYNPILEHLSPLQKKRLNICKNMVK